MQRQLAKEAEKILHLIFNGSDEKELEGRLKQLDSLIVQGLDIEDIIPIPYFQLIDLSHLSQSTIQYVTEYISYLPPIIDSYKDHLLSWLVERISPSDHSISQLEDCIYHHSLEDLLKRREDKVSFCRYRKPKATEILLGFGLLDMTSRVSYNGCSHLILPIERLMLDYAGLESYQGASDLIQNIRLLHRHGSPRASFKQMLKFAKERDPIVESEEKLVEIWNITYGKQDESLIKKIEETRGRAD